MTREFYKTGQLVPVTVLKVEKARVIQKMLIRLLTR
jgi:large subunit ribosomal protein L3